MTEDEKLRILAIFLSRVKILHDEFTGKQNRLEKRVGNIIEEKVVFNFHEKVIYLGGTNNTMRIIRREGLE